MLSETKEGTGDGGIKVREIIYPFTHFNSVVCEHEFACLEKKPFVWPFLPQATPHILSSTQSL